MSRFFRQAGDSDSDSESSDDESMSSGAEDVPQRPSAPTKQAPGSMSRFLKTAGSDSSDSDSDEDSDSDSDAPPARRPGLPVVDDTDNEDESDDEAPGVRIKSASERRLDEMKATGKVIENGLKINDWVAISNGTLHFTTSCHVY